VNALARPGRQPYHAGMKRRSDARFHAIWPTAWGPMAAVATPAGLARVILPFYHSEDLGQLIAFEHPASVEDPRALAEFVEQSRAYFNGRQPRFDAIACDLPPAEKFSGKILRACRGIPYGQTSSYGRLAAAAGEPGAARAAAAALGRNPLPLIIPCHRVTYADGRPGGFSAPGGVALKRRMLALEADWRDSAANAGPDG